MSDESSDFGEQRKREEMARLIDKPGSCSGEWGGSIRGGYPVREERGSRPLLPIAGPTDTDARLEHGARVGIRCGKWK